MSLATGTRLEHYEILGPLGAGGMGEVYRALDTKLRREVAIKVLPPEFARDAARLARFEREAHVLASLNHPNIAAIYGLEHSDGVRFIVLELVEGPTLAERMQSGRLETSEALRIAGEIAEALEAAHEKGVVHRDLKPANVKLTPGGKVKVLDFGLAKALSEPDPAPRDASLSPTLTMQETQAGIVLGTAAYMSPEQAEGKPTDKRADIWSFGVVLYEMLSGKRCFEGKTLSHILVHVLEQEPDWEKVPPGLRDVLKRCLQKDAARRMRDIGDVRLLLQNTDVGQVPDVQRPLKPPPRPLIWQISAAALALAVLVLGFLYFRPQPARPAEITRFEIPQPGNVTFTNNLAISPDGRKLAFVSGFNGRPQLWVRSFDAIEPRPLAGTDGAGGTPFWSPDSHYIVFWAQGKVQKIESAGGPAQTLFASVASIWGGFWTPDDKLVVGINSVSGLLEVPASGGSTTALTTPSGGEARHVYPSLLPDGRHFVYLRAVSAANGGIYVGSLDAKPQDQASKKLLADVSATGFVPSGADRGYLLFLRAGTLMAQPLDTRKLELAGEAVPVAEQVASAITTSNFSASATGVLVYRTGGAAGQELTWFDRQGKSLGTAGEPGIFPGASAPSLSPDGKRVAFARTDVQSGNTDIWLLEFARGVNTRFTFDPGPDQNPIWSPDGGKIVFAAQRSSDWGIYQKASNLVGGEELVYKSPNGNIPPTSWSRDGRYVLYQANATGVWALPMNGDHKPVELLKPEFNQRGARFSPDGRFFSYLSNETGRDEVYVRTFDLSGKSAQGGKWQISKDGGGGAHWRADGKEILYLAPDQNMMSVAVTSSPVFQAETPKPLFKSSAAAIFWDVTPDGQRFLIPVGAGANSAAPYTVVLNWLSIVRHPER